MNNPKFKLLTPLHHKPRDHNHYTMLFYNKDNDASAVLEKDKSFIVFTIRKEKEKWSLGNIRREMFMNNVLFEGENKLT